MKFKTGDKLVCIQNDGSEDYLTIGKTYEKQNTF